MLSLAPGTQNMPKSNVCPLWSAPFPCKLTSVAGSPGLRTESPGPLLTIQRPPRPSQEVGAQWGWGTVFFTSSLVTPTLETSGQLCWAVQSHQAPGGMLDWDYCTFLIWWFQGLKDVTILGCVVINFQTPSLKSKQRAGAQSTVLLLETQQWTRRKGLQLAIQQARVGPPQAS